MSSPGTACHLIPSLPSALSILGCLPLLENTGILATKDAPSVYTPSAVFLRHDKRDFYDAEAVRELGEDMPESTKPPWEQEADAFAAELLIPQEQLKKYQAELKNPEKLAGIFQVSRPAMVIAIANFFSNSRSFG